MKARTSNAKNKGDGNTKNSNKYLCWTFIESAHAAIRCCLKAKRCCEGKKSKANNAAAINSLAHKLASACFHILNEGKPLYVTRGFA